MDGSADDSGAWEYGRLEVLINSVWSILDEDFFAQDLGRRGARVACRSLGFATGAQLLVGASSPFPAPKGSIRLTNGITCDGSEVSLADCDIIIPDYDLSDYSGTSQLSAIALICSNPSGVPCTSPSN